MASKMVYLWITIAVAIAVGVGFSLTAPTSPTTAKSPDTENIQEAAATETAATLDKVTLRLKWLHQAQFAGFYTADQKGFYEKNGIDVTINPGGVDFPAVQMVASGSEHFGVTGADQILIAREKGV